MKNVCFVITSMGGGGAERNVSLLANSFCQNGHKVHLFLLFNNTVSYDINDKIHDGHS